MNSNKYTIFVTIFCALLLSSCSSSSKQQLAPMKLFPVIVGEKVGYVDMDGNMAIPPQFECAYLFHDGIAMVREGQDKEARFGYIKEDGSWLVKPQYPQATQFNDGLAWVICEDGCPRAIDTKGKIQIEAKEAETVCCFSEGLAAALLPDKDGYPCWGFIDKKGKVAVEPQFREVKPFSDGLAAVCDNEEYWGFVDKHGKLVIPCQYDEVENFTNGMVMVKDLSQQCYIIDKKGKTVIPPGYDYICPDGDWFSVCKNGKFGWIDKKGKTVIEPQFDVAIPFGGASLAVIGQGDKFGYVNRKGKVVVNPQYTVAFPLHGDRGVVVSGTQVGFVDATGKVVVNPQFLPAVQDVYGNVFDEILHYPTTPYPSFYLAVESSYIDPEMLANTRMTATGIGPVTIGMKFSDIPKSVKYLYDSVVVGRYDENDEMVEFLADAMFYLKGRLVFGARSWDGKVIGSVGVHDDEVSSKSPVYVQAGDTRVHVGDNIGSVARELGLKKKMMDSCGGPLPYYDIDGVTVYLKENSAWVKCFDLGEYLLLWD